MYTYDDLVKYDYFKNIDLEHALDSLTGVLARGYILGFAQKLIDDKVPFTMCIMDIDNFKLINDNYGHMAGDICLKQLGEECIKALGKDGLVGRYGGDEFVFIYFKSTDYDDVHTFLKSLCENYSVLRRTYKLDNVTTFVTGTIGCASYPKDSLDYDGLFTKVDKALYRGKTKGRNCFIIYVDEKHKNIDVHRREVTALPILFQNVNNLFSKQKTVDEIIKDVVDFITETLQLGLTFVVTQKDNKVISSHRKLPYYYDKPYIDFIKKLMKDTNIYYSNDLRELKDESEYANEYLTNNNVQSIIISKIMVEDYFYGYLVLYENKIVRIWQENDIALAMYVDKLLATLFLLRLKK